jgi:hypothetical protein
MRNSKLLRFAVLAGSLVALSVPALAQQVLQHTSETPSVKSAEKPRETEQQKAPASTVEAIQLNPQPLPPTPPDAPGHAVQPPAASTRTLIPTPNVPAATPPDPIRQVTPPVGSAANAVLPDNFFELNDRAIIVVGGKQMQVGQVKRELSAELERLSGPPVTVRSVARPGFESTANLTKPRAISGRRANVPMTSGPSGIPAKQGPAQDTAPATWTAGEKIEHWIEYCKKNPAKIVRVTGPLRPQQPFTIQGECFGERSGTVEMSGLPGKIVFEQWSNHRIVGVLPAVRGHADKKVNLTVVRADKARTAPAQADFVAARAVVEVPPQKWAPNGVYKRQFAVHAGMGQSIGSAPPTGEGAFPTGETFRLGVNPACALVDAAWTQRVGLVTAFNGWEHGPPHAADVDIQWAPKCVTSTSSFVVRLSTTQICEIAFDLKAWASCPLGVAP